MRSTTRSEALHYLAWIAAVGQSALLILPVILLVVVSFLTPSYTDPMYRDPLGIALLVAAALVLFAGGGLNFVAFRMLRAGRPLITIALALVTTIVCVFPALWLILLGPAVLIVLKKP